MIKIHHLGISQSERIVWLCEELELPYEIKHYTRDPVTRLSPPELKALHPLGAAPVIEDGDLMLAESAAIVEYIIVKHGGGRFKPGPEHADYADFLYWFHFSNGTLQPAMLRLLSMQRAQLAAGHPALVAVQGRADLALTLVETRLGEAPYLAGSEFTAADIMTLFTLTTMRVFQPIDLAPYPHIRAYVQRLSARPAYQRAMSCCQPQT
jgi:glutathione S-transferase